MKKYLLIGTVLAGALLSSCYYDPFYYGTTSASYGVSSFGNGYSTSFFVSTGDPRWAYDPYRYCYFDRYRSCYYDPFLCGYYPAGYCPVPIRGCPHPYNWSGAGTCPPPRAIRHNTLSRYDNRISNYQAANYHWARKVSTSGSSSWMSSHERSQLSQRASNTAFANPSVSSPSWMNGGLRRDSSNYGFSRPSSFPGRGLTTGSWGENSRQPNPIPTPRPSLPETPDLQLRPTTGGMFGGLNRNNSRSSSSSLRGSSVVPPIPSPRIEPSAPPSRSLPSTPSFDNGAGSSDIPSEDRSSGGGLRQFQR